LLLSRLSLLLLLLSLLAGSTFLGFAFCLLARNTFLCFTLGLLALCLLLACLFTSGTFLGFSLGLLALCLLLLSQFLLCLSLLRRLALCIEFCLAGLLCRSRSLGWGSSLNGCLLLRRRSSRLLGTRLGSFASEFGHGRILLNIIDGNPGAK